MFGWFFLVNIINFPQIKRSLVEKKVKHGHLIKCSQDFQQHNILWNEQSGLHTTADHSGEKAFIVKHIKLKYLKMCNEAISGKDVHYCGFTTELYWAFPVTDSETNSQEDPSLHSPQQIISQYISHIC